MTHVDATPAARSERLVPRPPGLVNAIPVWVVGRGGPRTWSAEQLARGLVLAATLCAAASAGATTYYVNNASPSCSDTGPGTQSTPYCTINAAITAHHGSGTTIQVQPGTYREEIHVPGSGASGSPLQIVAGGSPGDVVMEGADDFGNPAQWTPAAGSTYLAAAVNWNPAQVFADGARLVATTGSPGAMPAGTFRWVSGTGLYVNVGGGNPGSHGTLVGHRQYAYVVSAKSWVTIRGFTALHQEARGLRATLSQNVTFDDNTVRWSGGYGILADSSTAIQIDDNVVTDNAYHGIGLITHTSGCTVRNNVSARNAYPPQRLANGLYLFSSSSNTISNNQWHDNQDTGEQFSGQSNDNLSTQNRSWKNGDHGYDHLNCSGNVHIGDVAYGNYKDGFSIEGSAVNHQVWNCIAVDNGLTTNEFDLWVDGSSSSGFQSNDNLFWNSTSQAPVKYVSTLYPSVAAYSAASGQDSRTIQADPKFVDAASGDFHLAAGSPAIDDANSSIANWPADDAEGHDRVDDPTVSNSGIGPVAYADRGALEYQAAGGAAVPVLPVATLDAPPRITPNPVRRNGQLAFTTTRDAALRIEIVDASGRRVRTLLAGEPVAAGSHQVPLDGMRDDGTPLEAGLYWCIIRSPEGIRRGRFVVMH